MQTDTSLKVTTASPPLAAGFELSITNPRKSARKRKPVLEQLKIRHQEKVLRAKLPVETGLALVQAKKALGNPTFREMLDGGKFALNRSEAFRLMRIVGDKRIATLAEHILAESSDWPAEQRARAANLLCALAEEFRGEPYPHGTGRLI